MKKILIVLAVLAVLGVGGVFGVKRYKAWREVRLVTEAREHLAKGDYRKASLCARQAVQSDPSCVEACDVMADIADLAHATNAIFWRQRAVELEPANPKHHLWLARSALLFNRPNLALTAVGGMNETQRNTADGEKLQANAYWMLGHHAEADLHFSAAIRLEPTNIISLMNLQFVRLDSTNAATAGTARGALNGLATNELVRAQILRQLSTDAWRRNQPKEAEEYSRQLLLAGGNLNDQLRHLGMLLTAHDPKFQPALEKTQSEYRTNAQSAAVLARWMMSANQTAEALAWMKTLPATVKTVQPLPEAMTEALARRREWVEVASFLEKQDWEQNDYVRLAYLTVAAKEQRNAPAERSQWVKALKGAAGHLGSQIQLARMMEDWGCREEMEEALSAVLSERPDQKWARDYLSTSLHRSGKTLALQNLFGRVMEGEPTNHLAKSNFASLGLLLNPADKRMQEMAKEAFDVEPADPYIASTYALSLYFQKRSGEAVTVMEKLSGPQLEKPAIGVWYGFLLSETGKKTQAQKYLKLAEQTVLLPEEKRLLERAKAQG